MTSPAVGVVASIDTSSLTADVSAIVLHRRLTEQLGPVGVDFLTTVESSAPHRRSMWRSSRHHHRTGSFDAVVADARVADDDLRRAGAADGVVVTTDLWHRELDVLSLFESCLDPAALDARRRMLEHLGLLTDPPTPLVLPRGPLEPTLRPTDLYLLVRALGDDAPDDPRLRALVGGRTERSADIDLEIERIASELARAAGSTVTVTTTRLVSLEQQADELRLQLADATTALAAAASAAADALAREQVLLGRLAAVAVQDAVTDVDPDTPGRP